MNALKNFSFLVLTCFGADVDRVASAALGALDAHDLRRRFSIKQDKASPGDIYTSSPTPGGAHLKRALLYEPTSKPGSTVLFVDLEDGWWTLVNAISEKLSGTHAQVRCTVADEEFPMASFELWSEHRSKRAVSCMKDDRGKWIFTSVGEPLEFEERTAYKRHRTADRLSPKMVVAYMKALGWDVESPQFWQSNRPGVYLEEVKTHA